MEEYSNIKTRIDYQARLEVENQIAEFFSRGGKIEQVPKGESGLRFEMNKDTKKITTFIKKTGKQINQGIRYSDKKIKGKKNER